MPRARRTRGSRPARSYWPSVVLATSAVAGLPLALVMAIQAAGGLRSTGAAVATAAGLSVLVSVAGSALWKRRRQSRDIVFADLMLWGWIRRLRTERRLSEASERLGEPAELPASRRTELLEQLSAALEARDPYTHGHSHRVTRYAEAIARGMGLSRDEITRIRTAAAVHDVGKLKTPREVLNKPGRLTDEEFAAIKRHCVDGAELVAALGDEELTAMVRHHHERLDGRGYPDGLTASEIPLGARIIAVADTFDAITSTRPYRPGAQHELALVILEQEAGKQLDPAAVTAFVRYYSSERSVAWSGILLADPSRVLSSLLGWLQGAGAAPMAKGVVAAGATALVGGALATPASHPADARPVTARTAAIASPAPEVARTTVAVADTRAGEQPRRAAVERRARGARERVRRRSEPRPGSRGGVHAPASVPVSAPSHRNQPAATDGGAGHRADGSGGGAGPTSGPGGPDGGGSTGDGRPTGGGGTAGGSPGRRGAVTIPVPEVPGVAELLPVTEMEVPAVTQVAESLPAPQLPPVRVPPVRLPLLTAQP